MAGIVTIWDDTLNGGLGGYADVTTEDFTSYFNGALPQPSIPLKTYWDLADMSHEEGLEAPLALCELCETMDGADGRPVLCVYGVGGWRTSEGVHLIEPYDRLGYFVSWSLLNGFTFSNHHKSFFKISSSTTYIGGFNSLHFKDGWVFEPWTQGYQLETFKITLGSSDTTLEPSFYAGYISEGGFTAEKLYATIVGLDISKDWPTTALPDSPFYFIYGFTNGCQPLSIGGEGNLIPFAEEDTFFGIVYDPENALNVIPPEALAETSDSFYLIRKNPTSTYHLCLDTPLTTDTKRIVFSDSIISIFDSSLPAGYTPHALTGFGTSMYMEYPSDDYFMFTKLGRVSPTNNCEPITLNLRNMWIGHANTHV